MYEVINLLNQSKIVSRMQVLELVDEHSVQSVKIKTMLIDGSSLFIHETISERGSKYSYHWQTADNKLLLRWDNSPHYKEIETFPHHKHVGKNIEASHKVSIEEVLGCIEAEIKAE
ncbi:MAG: DUF6516 family protein, partial [Candidatus Desantisbacteria bacterium]